MTQQDYPLSLTVKDIQQILRIGRDQAYELTRRKDFPVIHHGKRLLIPRDKFFEWFDKTALQEAR